MYKRDKKLKKKLWLP